MDQALVRFRNAVARENRNRRRPRYSVVLQRQAVEYWRSRQRAGEGVREVAAALRVAPGSLVRWARACDDSGFHEVQIVAGAWPRPAPVVLVSAEELRVEGLDLDATAQLLRLLR
jgi:DNA-binding MurR/RpiR family transcriptional regulator